MPGKQHSFFVLWGSVSRITGTDSNVFLFYSWIIFNCVYHNYCIIFSYKKQCTWVSSNEADLPWAYHTKWSDSERERRISYINTYIWNLEKWYWGTYLQGSNGDAHIENRLLHRLEGRENGIIWGSSIETYTLPYVKRRASGNLQYDSKSQSQSSVTT